MAASDSPFLTVKTDRVRVTWNGPVVSNGESRVRVVRGSGRAHAFGCVHDLAPEAVLPLAVAEESIPSVLVESLSGDEVSVSHRDPGQISGLVHANNSRTVHGSVRVRDEAGWSVFTVLVGGTPEVEVALQVVPAKVTPADVDTMREAIEAVWRGAALAAWSAAQSPQALSPEASVPAWVALARHALAQMAGPLAQLARRPAFELMREEQNVSALRLRGGAPSVRAIRRERGEGAFMRIGGVPVREYVPIRVLRESEDIEAHRWIHQRLGHASGDLERIRQAEQSRPYAEHRRAQALQENLDQLCDQIRTFQGRRPLGNVSGARGVKRAPLLLRRRPVYRQIFEALRLLEHGLDIARGSVETAWLGTARVYEMWAVLQVVNTLADVLEIDAPEAPFGVFVSGARVRVGRGLRHAVALKGAGMRVDVAYEPRFGGPPGLLAQRPDVLLTVRAPGRPARRAILDAKYRRDDSAAYASRHGAPGPPEAALGDLHRYRDAIVDASGNALVESVAALYPYRAGKDFDESRLWRAHETVGIGAIPLVPEQTEWLEQWIRAWVSNDSHGS